MIVPVVVEGQSLRWYGRIPEIADNSIEFVQLEFRFPEDWDNMVIVAQFTQTKTYNCLLVNNRCFLPMELVAGPCEVSVFGYLNEEVTRGTTIPLKLNISRSGFVSSAETPIPPTPDLYAQLIEYFSSIAGSGGGGSGGGTINPEDIAAAVEDYLSKNPPEVPDLSDEVTRAETAASEAETASRNASASANNAGGYASSARDAASSAVSAANIADKAASDAEAAADRAEEAAKVTTDLDTTLTQEGKAADAKAVGDAISKLSGGNVELDATLTQSGKAADAKAVGDKIAEITGISLVEPAEDDIPKVYFTGTLPTSKAQEDVRLTMHYISKTADFIYPVTLKVQGASSANYPKKNFTLKPYKDSTYEKKQKLAFKNWPELNKFVLKAHWIDHSHVRNVGTAKIWGKIVKSRSDYDSLPEELRNSPNNGATDGFTVKVFCNGVYQGLYEWIVPKDKLFGQDSDIATHSILNSEWNDEPTCAFATTSPSMSGNWSEELQDSMSSDISTSFTNLIKFVAGSTDEEFVANAENYFDVQSVIDFDIFARVFCIVDNLCRNQIFFTYDGAKWYEGVWDVDAVLGLPPTELGFFAYSTEFQTGYMAYKYYKVTNILYQRVENLFIDRFKARYAELRSGVLSIENILDVYERLTDVITTHEGLLAEDYASTTASGAFTEIPYKTENTIQQIRNFVAQRIPYMDETIANMTGESGGENPDTPDEPDVPETIPCTGITLDVTELTFDGEGTQTITATVTPSDTSDSMVWVSSAPTVASITVEDNVCTVHSVRNGDAIITVTCGEYSATCSVSVSGFESTFNGATLAVGRLNTDTGAISTDSSWMYTVEPMDISAYSVLKFATSGANKGMNRIAFYDSTDNYISSVDSGGSDWKRVVVPENAKYVRAFLFTKGATVTVIGTEPVWDADTAMEGSYNASTGIYNAADDPSCCMKTPVTPNDEYIAKKFWGVLYYDKEDNFIGNQVSGNLINHTELVIPENVKSVALCARDYQAADAYFDRIATNFGTAAWVE